MHTATVYISKSTDPYLNLSIENWIFTSFPFQKPVLFLYKNDPSVVIGRFQNPWIECNNPFLKEHGIPVVRRQSGGGTVYHDMGNLNFTIFSSREEYSKEANFNVIISALKDLTIHAEVTQRNDIIVNGKKISGSAFKISRNKAFHHGTLLVESDLFFLKNSLKPASKYARDVQTKAVVSRASHVANIRDFAPSVTSNEIEDAIERAFSKVYDVPVMKHTLTYADAASIPGVAAYSKTIRTWEWIYGKTPDFTVRFSAAFEWGPIEITLTCRKGVIDQAGVETAGSNTDVAERLEKTLVGSRYSGEDLKNGADFKTTVRSAADKAARTAGRSTAETTARFEEIVGWLKEVMV